MLRIVALLPLINLVCNGAVWGWAAYSVLLENAGAFADGCESDGACDHQQRMLVIVYALALATASVSGVPAGMLLDRVGPARTFATLSVLMIAGLAMISSFPFIGSWVLFPGVVLHAAVGTAILVVSFAGTGLVRPNRASYVILSIGCFFDAGVLAPVVLNKLMSLFGSFESVFWAYTALCGVLLAYITSGWSKCLRKGLYRFPGSEEPLRSDIASDCANSSDSRLGTSADASGSEFGDQFRTCASGCQASEGAATRVDATAQAQALEVAAEYRNSALLRDLSLSRQLQSPEFLLCLLTYFVNGIKSMGYLGYLDTYLVDIGAQGDFYQNALCALLALGAVWVPFAGRLVNAVGLGVTIQCCNALGVLYLSFLLTDDLWAQWPACVIFGLFRALLYSFPPSLGLMVFGPSSLGRVTGLIYATGGIVAPITYGLTVWGSSGRGGGWVGVHVTLVAATVVPVLAVAWLQRNSREPAFRFRRTEQQRRPSGQARKKNGGVSSNSSSSSRVGGASGDAAEEMHALEVPSRPLLPDGPGPRDAPG